MIKKYGSKKGKEVFYASKKKAGVDYTKPRGKEKSTKELKYCSFGKIDIKESLKDFHAGGYIATDHPDKTNHRGTKYEGYDGDILPLETLKSIVTQINDRYERPGVSMCSERHDWIKNKNPNMPIAGAMSKPAELIDLEDGYHGVYVDTTVADTNPRFKEVVSNIKSGIYPGYSIEYEAKNFIPTMRDGKRYRLLTDINLHGYGFANARLIANPRAEITNFGYKEIHNFSDINNEQPKEVSKMEIKEEEKPAEAPAEEKPVEEKPAEEQPDDSKVEPEEKPKEEPKEEPEGTPEETEKKEMMTRFKAFEIATKEKETKEQFILNVKEAMTTMQPANQPLVQGGTNLETKEIEFKEMVGGYQKTHLEMKEWAPMVNANKDDGVQVRSGNIDLQFKEAGMLHDRLNENLKAQGKPGLGLGAVRYGEDTRCDMSTQAGLASNNFEVKESHWKNLEVKADPLTTTTSQISAATHYMAAAELADVYDPVIYNMLNDKTTFYGLLRKVDASKYSYAYEWRAIYAAQSVAGYLAEGQTSITPDSTDRIVLRQPFKFHYAAVRVTGPMIAASKGRDTVGNIMAVEVKDATRAFLKNVNAKLLTGTQDGSNDGDEAMGLTYVIDDGTTYTDMYIGVSRSTYKLEGNSESASSANITKGRLRKGIRACEAGDTNLQANQTGLHSSADKSDLIIVTHHLQKDKILALFDDAQRFNTVSARAGFEGMATFDAIPIHPDNQCTNSVLFIVDMRHTFLAVQVPPTFTAWGQQYNYDLESGFIKTYHNLVCTKPGNNYKVTSLATT